MHRGFLRNAALALEKIHQGVLDTLPFAPPLNVDPNMLSTV